LKTTGLDYGDLVVLYLRSDDDVIRTLTIKKVFCNVFL